MKLGAPAAIFDLNPYDENSVQMHQLGTRGETGDGRVFRYAWAGEALTLGHLVTGPAIDTTLGTMAVISGAAGATSINFTNGANTATGSYFSEGFAAISLGTGLGQIFKIDHMPTLVSGGSSYVYLEDPIVTALDTTSKLDIVQNPYAQCLLTATATLEPVGVPLITMTTQYYGWLQTRGVCAVLSDGTIVAGTSFFNDGSVAGAIDVSTEASWVVNPQAGRAYQLAGAASYYHPVFLTIE
jgi:hypothetical protein